MDGIWLSDRSVAGLNDHDCLANTPNGAPGDAYVCSCGNEFMAVSAGPLDIRWIPHPIPKVKPRNNLGPNVLGMKALVYGGCALIVLLCLAVVIWALWP